MIQESKIISQIYTLNFKSQWAVEFLAEKKIKQGQLFTAIEQFQNSIFQEINDIGVNERILEQIIKLARLANDLSLNRFRLKVATLITPKEQNAFRQFSGYFYRLYQAYKAYYALGTFKKNALALIGQVAPKDLPAILAQKKVELQALEQSLNRRFDKPLLTTAELSALQKLNVFQGKSLSLLTRYSALAIIRRELLGYQVLENELEEK